MARYRQISVQNIVECVYCLSCILLCLRHLGDNLQPPILDWIYLGSHSNHELPIWISLRMVGLDLSISLLYYNTGVRCHHLRYLDLLPRYHHRWRTYLYQSYPEIAIKVNLILLPLRTPYHWAYWEESLWWRSWV